MSKEYWRSLQELSRSDDFEEVLRDEFPRQAMALDNGVDRRDFVKLMSASMALAGLTACNRPAEKIVPYVRQPENLIPGKPLFFASTTLNLSYSSSSFLTESLQRSKLIGLRQLSIRSSGRMDGTRRTASMNVVL